MNKLAYRLMSAFVLFALTFGSYASAGASSAPIVAFPGAEGFGSQTIGGRSGQIIEVTNLNDSGAGSFRAAVSASGARIVVFKVSGIIQANSVIYINNPYLTFGAS